MKRLLYIAINTESVRPLESLLAANWVQDGLDTTEAQVIYQLSYLGYHHPSAPQDILSMPFMASITPGDLEALESLADIAQRSTGTLQSILKHPTLAGGITDGWTPIVAGLESPAKEKPSLIAELLNPASVKLQERTITLPLAGPVRLAIIRTTPTAPAQTMDLLENSVREAERFMQEPFPASMVAVLFAKTTSPGSAGTNYRSHIVLLPKYEDYDTDTPESRTAMLLAHEVAHYYWAGDNNWIDEGMATAIEAIVENRRDGRPIEPDHYPCAQADTLAQLDAITPDHGQPAFSCNYSLGERLFLYLHHGNDIPFREAAATLYRAYRDKPDIGADEAAAAFASIGLADTFREIYQSGIGILSPDLHPTWDLPELKTTAVEIWAAQENCQGRISDNTISAEAAQQKSLFICLKYEYQTNRTREVQVTLSEQHEDGFIYRRSPIQLQAEPKYISYTIGYGIGPGTGKPWKPGIHTFRITNQANTEIAALELAVTP